jgi:hypothetical protein
MMRRDVKGRRGSASNGDTLSWLLEDEAPNVRYLALRDLMEHPKPAEVRSARREAHRAGPIPTILKHMNPEGYWVRAGAGYNPKYRSTDWSLIMLAQLGASIGEDERIAKACAYLLDHGLAPGGQFTTTISGAPSGTVDCLQGNLCWALLEMGCTDPRLDAAFDWMARTVTGEGIAPASRTEAERRYYAYKCGPNFACGVNAGQACAWGGTKVLMAMARLPEAKRTARIRRAIQQGVDFMFSVDPATAAYPTRTGEKPSRNWWKFGFPVFYITDLLQLVEALAQLGYGRDKRLEPALDIIREKQDGGGRWLLEYDYAGKTWFDFGKKAEPNKWVTLRALRVLKAAA